jgi:hypothetical protein
MKAAVSSARLGAEHGGRGGDDRTIATLVNKGQADNDALITPGAQVGDDEEWTDGTRRDEMDVPVFRLELVSSRAFGCDFHGGRLERDMDRSDVQRCRGRGVLRTQPRQPPAVGVVSSSEHHVKRG